MERYLCNRAIRIACVGRERDVHSRDESRTIRRHGQRNLRRTRCRRWCRSRRRGRCGYRCGATEVDAAHYCCLAAGLVDSDLYAAANVPNQILTAVKLRDRSALEQRVGGPVEHVDTLLA